METNNLINNNLVFITISRSFIAYDFINLINFLNCHNFKQNFLSETINRATILIKTL